MDWINSKVLISNSEEAHNPALLKERGVRSIVSLDGSMFDQAPEELGVEDIVALKLVDGPNDLRHLEFAINKLQRLIDEAPPVLVHCHAGRSRSAAVVAATLAIRNKQSFELACLLVEGQRMIAIAPALVSAMEGIVARVVGAG